MAMMAATTTSMAIMTAANDDGADGAGDCDDEDDDDEDNDDEQQDGTVSLAIAPLSWPVCVLSTRLLSVGPAGGGRDWLVDAGVVGDGRG